MATESSICKSLQYPLSSLSLTEAECTSIMTPVLNVSLPHTHTCRNLPRAAVYSPKEEGGLGLTNLYTFQGCSHLSTFYEHISNTTMTGDLLRVTLEHAKLEIGVGRNLFSLNFDLYKHIMTDSWIKQLWQFCHEKGVLLTENMTPNLPLRRESDVFLMEIICNHGFTPLQLKRIN